MRTLSSDKKTRLYADERDADNGNASHRYCIQYDRKEEYDEFPSVSTQVLYFQTGPVTEAGPNGVTNEILLTIVADRLEGFQTGPFANDFNKTALEHIHEALKALEARTADRIARGVEGTNQV